MPEHVTMRDIARASGTSLSSVSRVLSGSDYPVRADVRKKILQTARKLRYVYNSDTAPNLEVAILIPTTANPFYVSVLNGFEHAVTRDNFQVMIYNTSTGFPENQSERVLQSLIAKKVQGVALAAYNNDPMLDRGVSELMRHNIRVVLVDSPNPNKNINCISYNYEKGSFIGTEYLIANGHRHIVYAGLKIERESRLLRVQGYRRAMSVSHLSLGEHSILLYEGDELSETSQMDCGERLSDRILSLQEVPTAVAAMNDLVALGLLRGFHKRSVRVPEEISVLGFDDSPYSEFSNPALTSVRVQAEQMGRMAAVLLMENIRDGSGKPVNLFVEPSIAERDTVAKI